MKNHNQKSLTLIVPVFISVPSLAGPHQSEKPNIVLVMAEDLSRNCLELYTENGAKTPNLDRLAAHGIVFNNAYSNAPVSSAARSSLITGCYAPSLGISWHRKLKTVKLPDYLKLFPYYLRLQGYFTTNAQKTDYNCNMDDDVWDIVKGDVDAYRKRKTFEQPFYHCYTIGCCHESTLHFPASDMETVPTEHNPETVHLYSFHPDTKLFRYTYARLYDSITEADKKLGWLIHLLEEDKLLDNTFIIFVGDNGGSLPFSKGYTSEEGLNVPMVMYIPDNWVDVTPFKFGERSNAIVQFLDISATIVHLSGGKIPSHIAGRPFAGSGVNQYSLSKMNSVFCYGDRYDELLSVNRTYRKGNFKYQRNFHPFQPKGLFCEYRYRQAAFREWHDMWKKGLLNKEQSRFFEPQVPEELYDLEKDPFELVNLATKRGYKKKLEEMRQALNNKMISEGDLALIPESVWVEYVNDIITYKSFMKDGTHDRFKLYYDATQLQILSDKQFINQIPIALASNDPIVRYWAITACLSREKLPFAVQRQILEMTQVPIGSQTDIKVNLPSYVRSRACVYCLMNGMVDDSDIMKSVLCSAENEAATLAVLNDIEFLFEQLDGYQINLDKGDLPYFPDLWQWRINHFKKLIQN